MSDKEKFDFEKAVLEDFKASVVKTTLKSVYNPVQKGECKITRGEATEATKRCGVYALFLDNELKKIGRAITGHGIFTRMSQYYRMKTKDGALKHINKQNRDKIVVWYFNLNTAKDCWAAEKYLQAKAYYAGEEMEWDDEVKKDS